MIASLELLLWFYTNRKNYRPVRRKVKSSKRYERCCEEFLRFVSTKYKVNKPYEITQDHYADFIRHLNRKGLSKSTINRTYKLALKWLAESFNLNFRVRTRRCNN